MKINLQRNFYHKQCIANNLQVDTDEEGTLLVKLYEPLPSNLDVKSTFWVVEEISSPQAYNVIFAQFAVEEDDIQFISGPNYSLNIVQETGDYKNSIKSF